ncbi:hypothetical protein AURDEDRAFT_167834 [Auricularia subglabra TFB-10046 SS5]|nr:hypothetical protein AURDEDRAFT_167834 [Auricularia subglabra TFB-10046 SS5]
MGVIGGALGVLGNDDDTTRKKVQEVLAGHDVLIVLDNFESAWEDDRTRGDSEESLTFLTGSCGVTVVVTLRGSARPRGVPWARPFLPPLRPLADSAAYQLFISIADRSENETEKHLSGLLEQLDGVPLAVVLLASLAQYESLDSLRRHWAALQTSMLQRGAGTDRHSSLDVSITLSLNSARMSQVPDTVRLLSLLSVLPSGAAPPDIELWGASVSPRALPTLLQCSLAFRRPDDRIQVLAPIRSFMLRYHAPRHGIVDGMLSHFFSLAEALHGKGQGPCQGNAIHMITPEVDNIHSAIRYSLQNGEDIEPALRAAVRMVSLYCHTGLGSPNLLLAALEVARSRGLTFLTAELLYHWGILSWNSSFPGDPRRLLQEARELYEEIGFINGTIDTTVHLSSFLPPHEAIKQLYAMYELVMQRGDVVRTARCCQELAIAHERLGDVAQMRSLHERALTHYLAFPGNTGRGRAYAVSLCGLGECDLDAGNIAAGMARLEKAVVIFRTENHNTGVGDVEYLLGEAHLQRGDAEIALAHLKRAFAAYQESGAANNVRCLYEMTKAHLELGDEVAALDAIEMADTLVAKDSEQSL